MRAFFHMLISSNYVHFAPSKRHAQLISWITQNFAQAAKFNAHYSQIVLYAKKTLFWSEIKRIYYLKIDFIVKIKLNESSMSW